MLRFKQENSSFSTIKFVPLNPFLFYSQMYAELKPRIVAQKPDLVCDSEFVCLLASGSYKSLSMCLNTEFFLVLFEVGVLNIIT